MKKLLFVFLFFGFANSFAQTGGFLKQNVPDLSIGRVDVNGALFPDGSFVVFGGHTPNFVRSNTAERWKEGDTAWTVFTMNDYRDGSAIVRIDSTHIMLAGGMGSNMGVGQINSTEIYNSTNNTFTPKANLQVARTSFRGAKLTNNKLLFVGNWYNDASYAEVYDIANDTFTLTGNVVNPRAYSYVIPRSNNGAVIMGGSGSTGGDLESIEIYDYNTNSFSLLRNKLLEGDSGWIYNTYLASGTYLPEDHTMNGKFYLSGYKNLSPSGTQYMIFSFDPDSLIVKPIITNTSFLTFNQTGGDSINFGLSTNFFINQNLERIYFWANNVNMNATNSYAMALYTYDINYKYVHIPTGYEIFNYYPISGGGCTLPNGKLLTAGGSFTSNFDAHPYCFIANPDNITGITEKNLTKDDLNIFPNPVQNTLNVFYNGKSIGKHTINIIDINGRCVQSHQINLNTGINTITMDTSTLPKGVYILQINNKITNSLKIFIKQ